LFQRFVSRVQSAETNPKQIVLGLFWICFGIVLRCFVSVVRAALGGQVLMTDDDGINREVRNLQLLDFCSKVVAI